jgi:hypothetical protein
MLRNNMQYLCSTLKVYNDLMLFYEVYVFRPSKFVWSMIVILNIYDLGDKETTYHNPQNIIQKTGD